MVLNTDLSQGQVVQRYPDMYHNHTNGVTWVFYPFIYQVAQRYISLYTYHINGVTILYSVICIGYQLPVNIFLKLHTHQFASGSVS